MSVHDELLTLLAQMHAEGVKLTYEAILERRGGGSRRDIARALRFWHNQRAQLAADAALVMPREIADAGTAFVEKLWSMMYERFEERLREVVMEANVVAFHADKEVEHLHKLLAEQLNEIDKLKDEVETLGLELALQDHPEFGKRGTVAPIELEQGPTS